ncbi:gliding motility-associated C-terminal domain-containing protein [Nonlabens sp. Asnod2-A12]|uniref:T9SS type B sorting domain-containing protein n=1 Tax=Nonlabens sp. Asnod2-A12 TaxID=3160578 RepID=UPI00386CEBF4
MKKLFLLTLTFLLSFQINAQMEASWWIFGNGAGLEFTPNPQVRSTAPFLLASGYNQEEGVASISDDAGNLLFFTNGSDVWNRNGSIMPNGSGLLGNASSTQAAIIVKAPETPGVYFIFTVGTASGGGPLAYSRVEMSLNGGLGDVVSGVKNIILLQSSAEKVSATIKTGSNNAYVMTFAERNATATSAGTGNYDSLFTWEVRGIPGAGISFVAATPIPQAANGNLPYYTTTLASATSVNGMLRTSPDGTKIAIANNNFGTPSVTSGSGCYLYEFNPGNGQFAGAGLQLDAGAVYGVEFSKTSQYLYCETGSRFGTVTRDVFQFDLCDTNNIIASKNTLATGAPDGRGTLQLGPDGIIYAARADSNFLGAILNADRATATYVSDYIDLSPGISREGLPVFIQSDFQSSFVANDQCQGDITEFELACLPQVAASMWDFGDGNTLSVTGPGVVQNTYATAGTYTVSVNVTDVSGDIRDFVQDIVIYENGIVDPIDTTLLDYCDDDNSGSEIVDLTQFTADVLGTQDAATFNISYHPTQTDAEMDTNPLPDNYDVSVGTVQVWVRIANNTSPIDDGCSAVASFDLTVSTTPSVSNIPDFELCDDSSEDGIEDFDLAGYLSVIENTAGNPVDVSYTYHPTQMDADMNTAAIDTTVPFTNTTSPQIVFVRLQNTNEADCFGTAPISLIVQDLPSISTPMNIEVCDDAPLDGSSDFILSDQDNNVDPTGLNTVSYYNSLSDADSGNNPLPNTYNVTGSEEIFVRSETPDGCFNTTSFMITVQAAPSIGNAPDLTNICDDSVDLNQNLFELSVQDDIILNGNSATDFTISYYTTDADAQAGVNALPTTYVVPFQAGTTSDLLFARLEDNVTGCFNTSQFTIIFERCEIIFPEGFSPNNDGINDTFSIPGLAEQYDNFSLQIFNRNGSVVYETAASNYVEFAGIPNSGVLSGDGLLPTGVYFYVIKYNDADIEDTASWVYINY